MTDTRVIRVEVELELAEGGTRLCKPEDRIPEIAAATAVAARDAYNESEATPLLQGIRWRYDIVKRVLQGENQQSFAAANEEV